MSPQVCGCGSSFAQPVFLLRGEEPFFLDELLTHTSQDKPLSKFCLLQPDSPLPWTLAGAAARSVLHPLEWRKNFISKLSPCALKPYFIVI